MPAESLVQPLFPGPLDIVGDIHGEIDALRCLLGHLGYDDEGTHPAERRLVFVGDLTDRGPDSPGVVELVGRLIAARRAQCVLGNHELNLLLELKKHGNAWFYGQSEEVLGREGQSVRQVPADNAVRDRTLTLFRRLPVALEREDRVVHACWVPEMIQRLRDVTDTVQVFNSHVQRIRTHLEEESGADPVVRRLAYQNENPVKVVTSGLECRADTPYWASGKQRTEARVRWWDAYEGPTCIFGHYWHVALPGSDKGDHAFHNLPLNAWLTDGRTNCIDFSVGLRWQERLSPRFDGTFVTRLASLRWPERQLVFDTGEQFDLE